MVRLIRSVFPPPRSGVHQQGPQLAAADVRSKVFSDCVINANEPKSASLLTQTSNVVLMALLMRKSQRQLTGLMCLVVESSSGVQRSQTGRACEEHARRSLHMDQARVRN